MNQQGRKCLRLHVPFDRCRSQPIALDGSAHGNRRYRAAIATECEVRVRVDDETIGASVHEPLVYVSESAAPLLHASNHVTAVYRSPSMTGATLWMISGRNATSKPCSPVSGIARAARRV